MCLPPMIHHLITAGKAFGAFAVADGVGAVVELRLLAVLFRMAFEISPFSEGMFAPRLQAMELAVSFKVALEMVPAWYITPTFENFLA